MNKGFFLVLLIIIGQCHCFRINLCRTSTKVQFLSSTNEDSKEDMQQNRPSDDDRIDKLVSQVSQIHLAIRFHVNI